MTQASRPKEGSRESFEEQFLCNFPERVVDPTMPKDREELQKLLNDAFRRGNQEAHDAQAITGALRAGVAVVAPEPSQDEWLRIAADARSADAVDFWPVRRPMAYGCVGRSSTPSPPPASSRRERRR